MTQYSYYILFTKIIETFWFRVAFGLEGIKTF